MRAVGRIGVIALGLAGLPAMANAGWINVYSNDFNGGASSALSGGGSIVSVGGFSGIGNPGNQFSGQYLVNDSGSIWHAGSATVLPTVTTLTLTGLADHTAISLSFLLAIRDTWDGSYYRLDPGLDFANYDYFNVAVDGTTIFSETFSQRLDNPNYVQSFQAPAGSLLTVVNRDYTRVAGPDSAYDMGLYADFQSIAHTGSTLTLSFWADGPGWQGGVDESWGMDNLCVSILGASAPPSQSVPEPETATILLAGLGILGVTRSRKAARR